MELAPPFRSRDDHRTLGHRLRDRASAWGRFVLCLDSTESTNDVARRFAERGAPHGSVVLARIQTTGRGRWRRPWASSPGGLYLSLVLRPEPRRDVAGVPILIAVGVCEAIQSVAGVQAAPRWPNDLLLGGLKVAGVLCESSFKGARAEHVVAGVGVNVNQSRDGFPSDVAARATSLRAERGGDSLDEVALADAVVERVESLWDVEPKRVIARWRELAGTIRGEVIRVLPRDGESFDAAIVELAEDGGLRVERSDGAELTLYSEDVERLKEPGDARQ